MNSRITFYKERIAEYSIQRNALSKKLRMISLFRLLIFCVAIAVVYFFWGSNMLVGATIVFSIVLFLLMLSKYTDIKEQRNLLISLIALNEREVKIGTGNFKDEPDGDAYKDATHFYSLDIDLFGRGSFFQYINRTGLGVGADELAKLLTANEIEGITTKQSAVKELADKIDFRQWYTSRAALIKTETSHTSIINWLDSYKSFTKPFFAIAAYAFSVISVIISILVFLELVSSTWLGAVLSVGLLITGRFLKKVNDLAAYSTKAKDTFKEYTYLLKAIEGETFESELLQNKQQQIANGTEKASVIFKRFSSYLDALDSRNNIFGAIAGNGFLLMDLRNSYRIEKWISANSNIVKDWFEVVSWFDAYNTLGNFVYNHESYVFPEIMENGGLRAVGLGHPLLNPEKRVDNSVQINDKQFFIVTGANMAGKSTFLRTVALHNVMANVGLPVCAESSCYAPIKLITSMRTSDSLTDDSSYFFSELKRLKYIVEALQKDSYFIILDEILKGTNSTDKAQGSAKFVRKLVASGATGIIATHDLSLCELADDLTEIENHYFDAEIVNDELYFDYKFKDGVCKNMNASFLLRKMEII